MAPKNAPTYEKDDWVFCFHGPILYKARVLAVEQLDSKDKKAGYRYRVHYKGWKNTWDDWVTDERLRSNNQENAELATQLEQEIKMQEKQRSSKKASASHKRKSTGGVDASETVRASEDRGSSAAAAPSRGTKRGRDWELEKEESYHTRPSVRIPIPDHIKSLLVDDWENVTKNHSLVPLPHPVPITTILSEYAADQRPKRAPNSASADLLEEVLQGVREYFNRSLGRILLYRFERQQWMEVEERMSGKPITMTLAAVSAVDAGSPVSGMEAAAAAETSGSNSKAKTKGKGRALEAAKHERNQQPISAAARATASQGNGDNGNSHDALPTSSHTAPVNPHHDFETQSPTPCDVYGAEHLSRLFVSLPELIAQTNMDLQSVTRVREELGRLMGFVGRNSGKFFLRGGAYVRAGDGYKGRVLGGHATISRGVPSVEGGVAGKRLGAAVGEKPATAGGEKTGRGARRGPSGVDSGAEGADE